jgi:hypothetical protein
VVGNGMRNPYGMKGSGQPKLVGTEEQDQPHSCTWLIAPTSEWTSNWIWIYMYLQTKPELILLNLIDWLSWYMEKKIVLPKVRI